MHHVVEASDKTPLRIAVLSDIHGNLEAFSVAIDYIRKHNIERVVCLGDIVGYGANPQECLDLVRSLTNSIVLGNHDEAVFAREKRSAFTPLARLSAEWTESQLNSASVTFLQSLPLKISSNEVVYLHSSPKNPGQWEYIFSSFEARLFHSFFSERLCFIGHTHLPGVYSMNPSVKKYDGEHRFIINVGSIGQPRDGDNRLSFGVLDTVEGSYENIRLVYNIEAAAKKIRETTLPRLLAARLFDGR